MVAISILAGSDVASAGEAQELFDSLFGRRLVQVRQTAASQDDIELADEMLKAAAQVKGSTELVAMLCDRAHRLALADPSGYPTALQAMETLARDVPDQRGIAHAGMIDVRGRMLRTARGLERAEARKALVRALVAAADADRDPAQRIRWYRQALSLGSGLDERRKQAVRRKLDELVSAKQIAERIDRLKARLDAVPNDSAAAVELLRVFVVELDDPAKARRFLFLPVDESWKRQVALAAKPIETLAEDEAMALATWYRQLAGEAPAATRPRMLVRARTGLLRFLQLHGDADFDRKRAELTLRVVDESLRALGLDPATLPALPRPAVARDASIALKGIDVIRYANRAMLPGRVGASGDGLKPLLALKASGEGMLIGVIRHGKGKVVLTGHHAMYMGQPEILRGLLRWFDYQRGATIWTNGSRDRLLQLLGPVGARARIARWTSGVAVKPGDVVVLDQQVHVEISDDQIESFRKQVHEGACLVMGIPCWGWIQVLKKTADDAPNFWVNRLVRPFGAQFVPGVVHWRVGTEGFVLDEEGEVVRRIRRDVPEQAEAP